MKRTAQQRKLLVRLCREELKTPPMSKSARIEAGDLLRDLQEGRSIGMPKARPMPSIGARCLELRVNSPEGQWRVFCRVDADRIVMIHLLEKKTEATPPQVIALCKQRLAAYDKARKG